MSYKRIALISDLHLDSWSRISEERDLLRRRIYDKCVDLEPDLIVEAGDRRNGRLPDELDPAKQSYKRIPVVKIQGNHAYYHGDLPTDSNSYIEPDLVANTLWTNFAGAYPNPDWVYQGINDVRQIRGASAQKVIDLYRKSLGDIIQRNSEIVVTHFPPSRRSTAVKFIGDKYNSYFVNDLDEYIEQSNHKLWMFGHVHHKHQYTIGNCLCVANPLGYKGEHYYSFDQYFPMLLTKNDQKWEVS